MPDIYQPTDFKGKITYLGRVEDREAGLGSFPQKAVDVTFAGVVGEAHGGLTRLACGRVATLHPRDTEIRNTRQLTILSAAQMVQTALNMGLETLPPEWVGASIVIEGIPDLSFLPPSSRLQAPNGTTLVVEMVNHPCTLAGKNIDNHAPGFGPKYKPATMDLRGVVAWVEREGRLELGDELSLFLPLQRPWNPEGA